MNRFYFQLEGALGYATNKLTNNTKNWYFYYRVMIGKVVVELTHLTQLIILPLTYLVSYFTFVFCLVFGFWFWFLFCFVLLLFWFWIYLFFLFFISLLPNLFLGVNSTVAPEFQVDVNRLLYAGHSMGGHGYATNKTNNKTNNTK